MQEFPIKIWPKSQWITALHHISPKPKRLYIRGKMPDKNAKFLTIIGSRKNSEYGEKVLEFLISRLAGYQIYIVSGLAFGIDSLAHEIALKYNLKTIAFPGSGLDEQVIYPKMHFNLAQDILSAGGCLISEFEPNQSARSYFFPQRNRLIAGISDAVLIIEAEKKSGTMITAKYALDFGKEVLCVPNSIFNSNAEGVNFLIKQGATPIYSVDDILEAMQINMDSKIEANLEKLNEIESSVLLRIKNAESTTKILVDLNIEIKEYNQIVSRLELLNLL